MKLTVFNGSPRGGKSNTIVLLKQFVRGFEEVPGNTHEIYDLIRVKKHDDFAAAFGSAEAVLFGFPLYTDAMPAVTKAFIEKLAPYRGRENGPPIVFVVQSGFPESVHASYVARYLMKLAERLGSPSPGVLIKGNGEGIRLQPPQMMKGLFESFYQSGKVFAETGQLDQEILDALAKPYRYPPWSAPIFKLMARFGVMNMYWNSLLKQNDAFDRRFDRPYE